MTSLLRRVALTLGIVLMVVVLLGGAATAVSFATLKRAEQRHSYDLSGSRLVVDSENASIHITPGASGKVELDTHLHYSQLSQAKPTASLEGDRLVLRDGCRHFVSFYCDVRYDLRVPASVALQVRSGNGEVRVGGMTGDLDLRTSNGAITTDGARAGLRLRNSNGPITATGLHTDAVEATTSNAGITLSFLVAPRRVDARSDNGGVRIVVPRQGGPYRVDADTSNGRSRVDVPTDPDAPSTITARTSNADLTISRA